MPVPSKVLDLISRFDDNRDAYKSPHYNETQVRREFIDPLFYALGWDVWNEQGHAEAYKDVIHEDAIKIGGATKAPDYCFRIGGTRKFFLEAKKPAVGIKSDPVPAYQLRRYAWSAKLPLSILTDFEELAVYDCRVRPSRTDPPATARTLYLTCDQYPEKWDQLAGLFSKDAVLKGSFDKYAESARRKRGTAEVDAEFLKEIERWRDLLARNFALRNSDLSQRDLNFAVQRTIDRIVFLRICEDRGIEPYGTLQSLLNGDTVYARLFERFRRADERYNSGLFHFSPEKDRPEAPDDLTPRLALDDKALKDILGHLYYPDCPYEFSVLPADILGQVYEQFLGKVIRLTPGHRAVVEEKPEVRKAGGVYYTPTYIVDYIVEHTVGKLVAGRTPQEVGALTDTFQPSRAKGARPLKVLDPACGSGSFLLGAYQFLLDWYRDAYVNDDPEKHASGRNPRLYQRQVLLPPREGSGEGPRAEWRLTGAERKRILLAHIYGVDIDSQAVETTKLSLLLKVLEGENAETIGQNLRFWHERALPDLAANIKCGNSLIGPDFYDGQQLAMFDEDERLRINVFDWQAEFPDIMQSGGFDAMIGNPPYIRIQTLRDTAPATVDYYNRHYETAGTGNYDIYVLFVERGHDLLAERGRLGLILPNKFFATDYGEPLRRMLSATKTPCEIVDFQHGQVFAGATTYTCLLFLAKAAHECCWYLRVTDPPQIATPQLTSETSLSALTHRPWSFATDNERSIDAKLSESTSPLLELPADISRGSSTGADDVFMLALRDGQLETRDGRQVELEEACLRTPLYASDFGRYTFHPASSERVIFPYVLDDATYRLMEEDELRQHYPQCFAYLRSRREELLRRKQYRAWYGFSAPRNLELHDTADLMVPLLADRGLYCRLPRNMNEYCPMASGGFTITIPASARLAPEFVLGLLNSRLLYWKLSRLSNKFRGGWITCTKQYVGQLPIHHIDSRARDYCDRIVSCVQSMLSLTRDVAATHGAHQRTALQRQIDTTDCQIDQLVYELYALTDDEIRIVEGASVEGTGNA